MSENNFPTIREISERISEVKKYVLALIGPNALSPKKIEDEKALNAAQENKMSLSDLKKKIKEYYKPLKEEAIKPWNELNETEKEYTKEISDIQEIVDRAIVDWNDRVREADRVRRQAEADADALKEQKRRDDEAAAQKAFLEEQKAKALASGDKKAAAAIEEEKKAVVVERVVAAPVVESKVMNRGISGTMGEKKVVLELRITNHLNFVNALIASGQGGIIIVDDKTLTAFKKYLTLNESVESFPGCEYRRGYDLTTRRK